MLLVGLFVHSVRKVHWAPRRDTRHFFIGHLGACAGRCSAALSLILICRFEYWMMAIFFFFLCEDPPKAQKTHQKHKDPPKPKCVFSGPTKTEMIFKRPTKTESVPIHLAVGIWDGHRRLAYTPSPPFSRIAPPTH